MFPLFKVRKQTKSLSAIRSQVRSYLERGIVIGMGYQGGVMFCLLIHVLVAVVCLVRENSLSCALKILGSCTLKPSGRQSAFIPVDWFMGRLPDGAELALAVSCGMSAGLFHMPSSSFNWQLLKASSLMVKGRSTRQVERNTHVS